LREQFAERNGICPPWRRVFGRFAGIARKFWQAGEAHLCSGSCTERMPRRLGCHYAGGWRRGNKSSKIIQWPRTGMGGNPGVARKVGGDEHEGVDHQRILQRESWSADAARFSPCISCTPSPRMCSVTVHQLRPKDQPPAPNNSPNRRVSATQTRMGRTRSTCRSLSFRRRRASLFVLQTARCQPRGDTHTHTHAHTRTHTPSQLLLLLLIIIIILFCTELRIT